MVTKSNPQRIGLMVGLSTSGCLILYFMLMKYMNLIQIVEFRYVNFLILMGGILLALNRYKRSNNNYVPYLEGFGLGLLTTAAALAPFAAFVGVYLSSNPLFMEHIKQHVMMGSYLNPVTSSLGVLVEGCISGLIISFACMQYFKQFVKGPAAPQQ